MTTTSPSPDAIAAPLDDTTDQLPPEKQVTAAIPEDTTVAQAAQVKREVAWQTRADWSFLGKTLEPWSMGRESLFVRLIESDTPGESLENITLYEQHIARVKAEAEKKGLLHEVSHLTVADLLNAFSLLPAAAKVLYLAAHKPDAWDHLRGKESARFLRAIEEWSERTIPPDQHWPAILLARDIRDQHRSVIAVRRPSPGGSLHSGN